MIKACDERLCICEWGQCQPWFWAREAGGQLWRTTYDIRDKWSANQPAGTPLHKKGIGYGILDIVEINAALDAYAGPGGWNDPDMLVVGLYGRSGPSGHQGGAGCTDTEYRSQMSLWCLMAAPLMITNDVRDMNQTTREILTNRDILAIDQDPMGVQARRLIHNDDWQVFVKPLHNGDYAVGILNTSETARNFQASLAALGIPGEYKLFDVWSKKNHPKTGELNFPVASHETLVFRLSK